MKTIVGLALLAIVVVGGLAIANLALDRRTVKNATITEPVREIVVTSDHGDVELVPSRRGVGVRETQHHVLRRPTLERTLVGGVLTLDSHCDSVIVACYADLRLRVPAGVGVTVEVDSGDVDLRRIEARHAHVRSDSGDVRLRLLGSQRLVWAHTDSGDLDVVAVNARAVDAQSDSGSVVVAAGGAPRRIVARTDAGDVTVAVPRGAYAVTAHTDSGEVDVRRGISRNDRAPRSIDARTDSGDVTLKGG